ncbi:hypothetical protein [Aquipuribacter hungaricus]|uniref:Uncharacterized protein n=1 Tax=Aquipuribacter hungaricus TaxID=545624 RepID=A0ABV7WDY6_9MICO
MTTPAPAARSSTGPLVAPFPQPAQLVRLAYRELHIAATGTKEQIDALGDLAQLPRPWDPASCLQPQLRRQVWDWLEQVVTWLNAEYVWDAETAVLPCWPQHPHLVHEIAVLADQRRRAGKELTSDAMEDWHRYSLPAFQDRTRTRTKGHCQDGHEPWPAKGRHTRHTADATRGARAELYDADVLAAQGAGSPAPSRPPRLSVVDLQTGELDP